MPDAPIAMPAAWWTSSALAFSLWMTWSGLQAVRFIVGGLTVRRARRLSEECPSDVLAGLSHWSRVRTTGRPTRVVLSDRVRHAAVLGFGSPIIALAPRLLTELSAPDLDRVLVHEWAHVQRRDDLAQLLQHLVRAIAGWHPAVWWLERRLDFEREVACDEVAVDVTGSAKGYAACLVTLAGMLRTPIRSLPGLAAVSAVAASQTSRADSDAAMDGAGRARVTAICGAAGLAVLALVVSHVRAVSPISRSTPASNATEAQREPSVRRCGVHASSVRPSRRCRVRVQRLLVALTPTRPCNPFLARRSAHAEADSWRSSDRQNPSRRPRCRCRWRDLSARRSPSRSRHQPRTHCSPWMRPRPPTAPPAPDKTRTPWAAAADAGVAIGRTSQSAGVATAGFFSRFGKKIARSF